MGDSGDKRGGTHRKAAEAAGRGHRAPGRALRGDREGLREVALRGLAHRALPHDRGDRLRYPALALLDARQARARGLLPPRGQELPALRAQGQGPHHGALELPLPAPRRAPRLGDRGRQRGHRQALEQDPRHLGPPGLAARVDLRSERGGRVGGPGQRPGPAAPRAALRPCLLHGQPQGGGPRGRGGGAHARRPDPRARGQVADGHPPRRRHRGRCREGHVGQVPERGPDLHRPGLPLLPQAGRRGLRHRRQGRGRAHVRPIRGGPALVQGLPADR